MERTEEQKMFLATLTKAVKERIAPKAAETDRAGVFDAQTADLLWDLGVLSILLPEEHGGFPVHPGHTLCLAVETIARACASSALLPIIQAVAGYPLVHSGSPDQKALFFPNISEQRTLMAYLVTEPGAGSDVAAIATRARRDGRHFVLTGRKVFATNGAVAGLYSVLARTGGDELSFFLVERDTPGLVIGKIEDKCGFRGSNTAEVILDDVRIPEKNLLGRLGDGFMIAMADFDMSRPAVAALALGLAEGAVEEALRYARERTTFGQRLIDHQAIAFTFAEAYTLIEAGRGLMERAARDFDAGRKNTHIASMAKTFCSDAAMRITTDMVQVMGGYGYTRDFPLERMFRDAKLTQIFEGANQIQQRVIAREMVKRMDRGHLFE